MKQCNYCKETKPYETFAKSKDRRDGYQPRCRGCQKLYSAPWRETNRASLRVKSAIYDAKNRERNRARSLAWDAAHRQQNRNRHAAARRANPEKFREQYRAYQQANREKETARVARWRTENPEIAREAITRYRTRKRKAFVAPVNRKEIYERDKGICQICFMPVSRKDATLDHIVPLSRDGTHEPSNVQIAHGPCNSSKGARVLGQSKNATSMNGYG